MFINISNENEKVVALNLNACDSIEIHEERKDFFILRLSKQFEPPITVKVTIQSYSSYEEAFADFESLMKALASEKQVWSPQQ